MNYKQQVSQMLIHCGNNFTMDEHKQLIQSLSSGLAIAVSMLTPEAANELLDIIHKAIRTEHQAFHKQMEMAEILAAHQPEKFDA